MSTNPNESNIANATEFKPASKSGLMRKTKSELVQIILCKDKEFVEDKNTIKSLKAEIVKKDNKINNLKIEMGNRFDKINNLEGDIKNLTEEKDKALKKVKEADVKINYEDNTIKNKQQEIDRLKDYIKGLKGEMNDTIMYNEDVVKHYNTSKVFNIILAATTIIAIGIIIFFM